MESDEECRRIFPLALVLAGQFIQPQRCFCSGSDHQALNRNGRWPVAFLSSRASDGWPGHPRFAVWNQVRRRGRRNPRSRAGSPFIERGPGWPVVTVRSGRGLPRRFLSATGSFGHDAPQIAQESGAFRRTLHQHAAAIQRIDLAAREVQLTQTIQGAGDRRLRHIQSAARPRTVWPPSLR